MAYKIVQHVTGTQLTSDGSGNTVAPAWSTPTSSSNLLLTAVNARSATAITCSTSGWIQAVTLSNSTNRTEIWYKSNSIVGDSTPVFVTAATTLYAVHICEVSGTSGTLDKTATTTSQNPQLVGIGGSAEFMFMACGVLEGATAGNTFGALTSALAYAQGNIDVLNPVSSGQGLCTGWGISAQANPDLQTNLSPTTNATFASVMVSFFAPSKPGSLGRKFASIRPHPFSPGIAR